MWKEILNLRLRSNDFSAGKNSNPPGAPDR
jgi:hypothetical protein